MSWFNKGATKTAPRELSIDELITLGHLDDALSLLSRKVQKQPGDLRSRLRLAQVLEAKREGARAIEEYVAVADAYYADGFFDKSISAVRQAQKLAPHDDGALESRVQRAVKGKQIERTRDVAVGALTQSGGDTGQHQAAIELEQLWDRLARTPLVAALEPEQITRLLTSMQIQRVAAGEVLVESGSRDSFLVLVASGRLEALLVRAAGPLVLRTFEVGDLVGESSLLQQLPWRVTLRAEEQASVLQLSRSGLEKLLVGNPDPRGTLDVLRSQNHDAELHQAVEKIVGSA